MVVSKGFKSFDDALLTNEPELKEFLKPNDYYPEVKDILKRKPRMLPIGSLNTRVIINEGKIVERVYKTPKGNVISIFSKSSNSFHQVAC